MRFADVVGHARAVGRLRRIVVADRVPAAVLLLGPPGIGKRLVAEAFAARLLCESPTDGDACGGCAQCTRVAAATHPDRRLVARDEDRRDIRIEQVRETSRWLALRPLMAARKIAVIDGAHCLSEPAQNALLKTLEEPPPGSVLVLIGPAAALLLPTIRSRCQIVRLDPLGLGEVRRVLEARGIAPDRARQLAPLAEGRPGAVLGLEAADHAGARDEMLRTLAELSSLGADRVSRAAQALSRGALDVALAAAVSFYRDVLQVTLTGGDLPLRNPDVATAVRAAAARVAPAAVLRQLDAVCGTIDALGRNANKMLSLETMLLWLREIERSSPHPPALAAVWESAARA